jgi:predicted nucleic acid-binding protein
MSRIFWDTNLFVYLIEDYDELSERVTALRTRMLARGDHLFTSTFTLGEVVMKPLEQGRDDLRQAYEQSLTTGATIVPFDRDAALAHARIRGDRSIKPPDAIQLACASAAAVDLFITNAERLSQKSVGGVHFLSSLDKAPL